MESHHSSPVFTSWSQEKMPVLKIRCTTSGEEVCPALVFDLLGVSVEPPKLLTEIFLKKNKSWLLYRYKWTYV